MKRSLVALALSSMCVSAYAQSDVYLCTDANGNREYKNTGATKGCKKVDLPGVTTIPGTAPARKATTASVKPASSPSDFPRVDDATQKARDSDRKSILQEEVKAEERKLSDLRATYNNGEPERQGNERNYAKYQERVAGLKDDIARSEKNIEALKRELGNLK